MRSGMRNVAIVAGATGIVGHRLVELLSANDGWQVIGLSRRSPRRRRAIGMTYLEVDLTDANRTYDALRDLSGVTHVFNAARYDHVTTAPEDANVNTTMLVNLIEALERARQPLRHVHLVQGSKYYGSNLGAYRTPSRESDPRSLQGNFYYEQEDICIARSASARWAWSASRPHGVSDSGPGLPRTVAMVIAIYAAISRELGIPMCFPGTAGNFRAIYQCTDARHLAKAIVWMATTPACENQAFNVTNADFFRWCNLWPRFASAFGMEWGGVRTVCLEQVMADKAAVWKRIVAKHNLEATPYAEVALWSYGDFIFTPDWDMMSDNSKSRKFGFYDSVDSEEMFYRHWDELRTSRIIPPS